MTVRNFLKPNISDVQVYFVEIAEKNKLLATSTWIPTFKIQIHISFPEDCNNGNQQTMKLNYFKGENVLL